MAIALSPTIPPLGRPRPTAHGSIRRHLALSLGLGALLVVGVGGWATLRP